jgi:hypothetical protein
MRRTTPFAIALGLALALVGAAAVMAHEGEEGEETLAVEPTSVTAGQRVLLVGTGLEPDSERVLVLAGGHLVIEFGTVRTDAEGTFQKELIIPDHLPTGTYEIRAIGDETLTASLGVTAVAAGEGGLPPDDAQEAIVPRQRSVVELGLILGLMALIVAAGGLLAWRAERIALP